jgi:crotonobetainyl-CoA:carnitine CoA-transferase CaiB-like acyl-CoA transferase
VRTNKREIAADQFFTGMFETALQPGEVITAVRFPKVAQANYQKFRNPASRYAIVGVFVARTAAGVRVAVTGAGACVFRVAAMETALAGNFSADAAPHGCYRCKGDDRWCAIAVDSQEDWIHFCEIAGHREWIADPRFADLNARVANRQELDATVEQWTRKYTPHQVTMMLQRENIAAGIVQTAEDLYRDPHLRERGFAREVFHRGIGWVTRAGPSVRLTERRFQPRDEAHVAGEDNEAVFGEILGLSRDEIDDLTDRKVLR